MSASHNVRKATGERRATGECVRRARSNSPFKACGIMCAITLVLHLIDAVVAAETELAPISGFARVVDGDTIDIGDARIRIEGIDAPEAGQRCLDGDGVQWRCGRSATRRLEALIGNKTVECTPSEIDDYGRFVSRCLVGGVDLGGVLIDDGLAWAFVKFSFTYVDREEIAQTERRGIWAGSSEAPWDYRARRWTGPAGTEDVGPEGCPIKGNISGSSGERIYHMPWSPWYEETRVDLNRGERWFCDEAEALSAGWRPAGR